MNKRYSSDLTDVEGEGIKHFFERPDPRGNKGYHLKRTFAWINNFQRASKNFEILTSTAENVVRIAMIRVTLKKCF